MSKSLSVLLTAALLGGCNFLDVPNPASTPDQPSDPATETFATSLGVNIATMKKTTNGVYYADLTVGTGATLDSATTVLLDDAVYLKDATSLGVNHQLLIGMQLLVPGLIEGMLGLGATGGMREGGNRLIVVPSELAYANTSNGQIPPNSTIVYNVTLDQIP